MGFHFSTIISTMLARISAPSATASSCQTGKSTPLAHWARMDSEVRMT